jgi:chromosome segregation ATPase
MSSQIIRRLKPEEEEVLRKREDLAAVRAALAERELELVDLRAGLAAFEGRYLRQVGTLYAELDEWKARISELYAQLNPTAAANARAREARQQARQAYEHAHGKASEPHDFIPSPFEVALVTEITRDRCGQKELGRF